MRSAIAKTCGMLVIGVFAGSAVLVATLAPTVTAPEPLGPIVVRTATGPTGYEVRFRYDNPAATRVQLIGEWGFAEPDAINDLLMPEVHPGAEWQPGDIPVGTITVKMVKNPAGIWEYVTPLPSGTFSYSFLLDCGVAGGLDCTSVPDPVNPQWRTSGADLVFSQVYVPSDPSFGTADRSAEQPDPRQGAMLHLPYPSTAPSGTNDVAIYLPYGYDPNRVPGYPTVYLSHGLGGTEVDWSTKGAAATILENAVAGGAAPAAVLVMTNFNDIPNGIPGYSTEVLTKVIPFVEATYNVSPRAQDRAFGGLSMGGARAVHLFYEHPESFGYFGIWSAGVAYLPPTNAQLDRMKKVTGIHLGTGLQDFLADPVNGVPIVTSSLERAQGFAGLGLPTTSSDLPGTHTWDVWRYEFDQFLRKVAFHDRFGVNLDGL